MKVLCPSCNTINDAVGFNLSEQEIYNNKKLGLSEHLCKSCYEGKLSSLTSIIHDELIPLNEAFRVAQIAYSQAHEAWKAKADLFRLIDYNINMIKISARRKEAAAIKKYVPSDKPVNIEALSKKIIAGLSQEQQMAIMQAFQTNSR